MEIELQGVKFDVDETRTGPAYFILGIRKSGSSMLNRIARQLARYNNYNFIDVGGRLFSNNVRVGQWIRDPSFADIVRPGNVYGGFRNYPSGFEQNKFFREGKKVLLVRDPRDALVSEYFSSAYSHSLPSAGGEEGAKADLLSQRRQALVTPIEESVLEHAKSMRRTVAEYLPLARDPNTLVLRYEDIIFEKAEMINKIVNHFGWTCRPKQLEAILGWVDVVPETENPKEFIRKVTPGDHKEKLSAAAIQQLNRELADVLTSFRYH